MFPECLSQDYRVLATVERARNVLEESIQVGKIYWVPFWGQLGTDLTPAGHDTYYISFNARPHREVNVYVRAEVAEIYADVDDNGKPVVKVILKTMDRADFAIQSRDNQVLTHGLDLGFTSDMERGQLCYCPNVPLPEDLQGIQIAPGMVRTNRQILRFLPINVRIEYNFF